MPKIEGENHFVPEKPAIDLELETDSKRAEVSAEVITEKAFERNLDRLAARVEGVSDTVSNLEKVIPPDKSEPLRKKLNRTVKRSVEVIKMAALMAALSYIPDAGRPRQTIEQKTEPSGEIVFKHPDQQTTQILNYLSGKAELPHEIRLQIIKDGIKEHPEQFTPAKDLDTYNESQLRSFVGQQREKSDPGIAEYINRKDIDWLDIYIPAKDNFDSKLYENLWKIEQEVGNPKIRWGKPLSADNAGHFSPSNTIYLESPFEQMGIPRDIYIGEAAHAKQFKEKPFSTSIQFAKDMVRTVFAAVRKGKSLSAAQSELYNIPGTVEYEAHKVIEPELMKKIEKD